MSNDLPQKPAKALGDILDPIELHWKRDENERLVKSACRTHSPLTSVCIIT